MKRLLLRTAMGAGGLLLLAVFYVGLTFLSARSGLPQWEGALTAQGLDDAVEIIRDEHGIPSIRAATAHDLYFAQGFVHAQDRFWQMALTRRSSQGRLSEWMGAAGLSADRSGRMWNWTEHAEQSWAALAEEDRRFLEAYAAGVNHWLTGPAYRRPPEMTLLHVHPEPWRPEDVFLVSYQIYLQVLNSGQELTRAHIRALGADSLAAEMLNASDRPTRPIVETPGPGSITQATGPVARGGSFSNNWTLSGAHTASGRPLMANDPQLPQTLPGPWQLQHHVVGTRTMAGGTIPGLPGVVMGHNGAVAWGVTAGKADLTDVALLERHPDDSTRYRRGPDAPWESFAQRRETINVRFGDDLDLTVRSTDRGIVLNRRDGQALFTRRTDVVEEFRNVAFDHLGGFPTALLRLNRAATVAEAIEAGEGFTFPSINLSLADTAGTIGYVAVARLPVRPERHARVVGAVPGDDNAWTYLPYAENPRTVNPPSGRIVTANQRVIGDAYPHYLTDDWAAPWRANRIHELLDARSVHDVASFRAMQQDALSPVAREVLPLLLAVDPSAPADAVLVDVLRDWDARFDLDSPAPIVFLTWVETLNRRLVADEMAAVPPRWRDRLYLPIVRALGGDAPEWCDDQTTDAVERCPALLRAALTDAREAIHEAYGSDPAAWRWSDAGRVPLPHLGFADLPVVGGLFSRAVALPGGPESLFVNTPGHRHAPRLSAATTQPAYQGIYDLADLDASLFMTGGGTSGHFRSPYYNNLTALWARGDRVRLTPESLVPAYTLVLTPAG
jgi:penicillin amidase